VIDRIRVVSNANQNLVLNPNDGSVQAVAPNVFFAAGDANNGTDPNVVFSAYTNNFAGAGTTTLYGIDTNLDVLVTQVAATGALSTVNPVGADLTEIGGFDISGLSGIAYACTQDATLSRSTFWTINLATGQGTMVGMIGAIGGGEVITAMTLAVPGPGALAIMAVGVLGLGRRRRN